jgi:thioester reductase-like protein
MGAVLLTGATGFVGGELLARFLERGERRVYALVRASDDDAATGRLRELGFSDGGCLRVVAGDIERPGLGLDGRTAEALAEEVTTVVHCAASVSFELGLADSRRVNVEGTRRVVELAEHCARRGEGLERLTYVSTAYVAGARRGCFREDQLDVGQRFRNPYERSKFEAELVTRERAGGLPLQVLRPSIVVGDRASGWTNSFNVIYTPLKAFARGAMPAVPARRRSPVDIVPVDYVADAAHELASNGPEGTFHLVSGRDATTVGRLIELASRQLRRRPPAVLPPGLYRRLAHPLLARRHSALRRSEVYFPYFSMRVRFDDRRARERLEPAGIRVTPVEEYFHRLLAFAEAAGWGRRKLARAEARTLARN